MDPQIELFSPQEPQQVIRLYAFSDKQGLKFIGDNAPTFLITQLPSFSHSRMQLVSYFG